MNSVSELVETYKYFEDRTPEIDESVTEKLTEDEKYSRIDVRLELSVNAKSNASVSVRYIILP